MYKVIVFDLETTGLDPLNDMILEIGAIPIVNGEIRRDEGFERFVNPGIPIPAHITGINGITDEMVRDAPFIEKVLPEFLSHIGRDPLVAHNAPFDIGFLTHFMNKCGYGRLTNAVIDTKELSKECFPRSHRHNLDILLSRLGISSSSENRHRSMGAAYLTARAYLSMRGRLNEPQ